MYKIALTEHCVFIVTKNLLCYILGADLNQFKEKPWMERWWQWWQKSGGKLALKSCLNPFVWERKRDFPNKDCQRNKWDGEAAILAQITITEIESSWLFKPDRTVGHTVANTFTQWHCTDQVFLQVKTGLDRSITKATRRIPLQLPTMMNREFMIPI